jgi:hypothetical protein
VRTVAVALVAGLALAAGVAGSAIAAKPPPKLIVPGEAIGPVRLGMTLPQVKRALGKPVAVSGKLDYPFGGEYLELQWRYATWTVGLRSTGGPLRVVRISTTVNAQRTRDGVGSGSKPSAVLKAFPRATCVFRELGNPWPGTWLVAAHPNGNMTAFSIYGRRDYGDVRPNRFVIEVVVQERWYARSPFDSDCGANWREEFRGP